MPDEFYIGYLSRSPAGLSRFNRRLVTGLGMLLLATVLLLARSQAPQVSGRFEFGVRRPFTGVIYESPVPYLHVTASAEGTPSGVNFLLVGPGKRGLPAWARGHAGRKVQFNGTLIYQRGTTMVEVNDPDSFQVLGEPFDWEKAGPATSLGTVTLTGELVDTKCYFGVMRPATGKVHRACAARCLSGGAPPGLLVRSREKMVAVLLAGADGQPLRIDPGLAARILEVRGELELRDGLPLLRVESWRLAGPDPG